MSPMIKTPLTMEYVLLGFLRQRPMHAYEMHQVLTQAKALGLVWHVKQSQLYAHITRLEDEGYVTSSLEPQLARPARKILRLTPAGEAAFDEWVSTPVAHGREFRLDFLAKLFFASQSGSSTLETLIERQRQASTMHIERLDANAAALGPERHFDYLVLRFRIGQLEASVAWLDECARTFATPTTPPPVTPLHASDGK
ncbi:MAG TPA: PadR family transcriptional regulator [Nitrolancea sp.]|jgi:DNA-binding PadR family transcriptional regulator|nr:PadR family transcriptional regulator [Nitrolancea sp.]